MRPVFRGAAVKAAFRNVKAICTMLSAQAAMKAFISIDMEGICGVVREIETDPIKGGEAYQQSRHLMTQEAKRRDRGMREGRRHGNLDRRLPLELRQPDPGRAARGRDPPPGNAARVLDGGRARYIRGRSALHRISRAGRHAAID